MLTSSSDAAARKKFEAPLLDASPFQEANAIGTGSAMLRNENEAKAAPEIVWSRGQVAISRLHHSRRLSLDPAFCQPVPVSPLASSSEPLTPLPPELESGAATPWNVARRFRRGSLQVPNSLQSSLQSSWVSFVAHVKELDGVGRTVRLVQPIQRFIFKTSLDAGNVRLHLKWLVAHTYFESFISVCIGLSIFSMTFDTFQAEEWQNELMEHASTLFTCVFGLEVILKLAAVHPALYFADNWNRFDYAVSMLALLAFPLEQFSASFNPKVIRAVRLVRVLRSIRVFKFAQGLAQLIQSIVRSFPSVSNLFAIVFLGTFVFAVLGVELFGDMCILGDDPLSIRCRGIDESYFLSDRANFRNLGNACYVMYRLIISDNWSSIFQSMIVNIPNCSSKAPYNTCGIPLFAPFYFITFVVITTLSLLNILVAIMIYFFDAPDDVNVNLTPHLTKDIFLAVLRRWKRNAVRLDSRLKIGLK
jgi:hypothetical protein